MTAGQAIAAVRHAWWDAGNRRPDPREAAERIGEEIRAALR